LRFADDRHKLSQGNLSSVNRSFQTSLNRSSYSGRSVADGVLDSFSEVAGNRWWGQECLELLLFSRSKFDPDGGSIGLAKIADFFENFGYLAGELLIGFRDSGADEFKELKMGG
jgi:hypothetical protein